MYSAKSSVQNSRSLNSDNNIRKWLIGGIVVFLLILLSLFFFSKTVTAQRSKDRVKMVTSVEIKKGDSLWSIASDYITEDYGDIKDYIDELKSCNGLTSDTIHAGRHIIVPYYVNITD